MAIKKKINWGFDAVAPNGVPDGAGDRYYSQDLMRDLLYLMDRVGLSFKDQLKQIPFHTEGGEASQGAGTNFNITAGVGYVKKSFQTVLSYVPTPPTTQDEDVEAIRVAWTAQTDLTIAGWTAGGAVNYLKVAYVDLDGTARSRAKKAGTWAYDSSPSFVFTASTVAPTAYELCLCTFTEAGSTFTFSQYMPHKVGNKNSQVVVYDQTSFNNAFYRFGANAYYLKPHIKSIHFRYLSGGYQPYSLLSGGDTWGDLYTNACSEVTMESGTFIQFSASGAGAAELKGNMTVNTDHCYLKNVWIKGTGVTVASITESFKLGANYVTFDNCKTSNRLSNVDFVGFQGSGTALHNTTSKYRDCSVFAINGTDKIYGFKDCGNLSNCLVYNITGTGDIVYGFYQCSQVTGCMIKTITTTTPEIRAFYGCTQITGCFASGLTSTDGAVYGFYSCNQMSACQVDDSRSTNGISVGHSLCYTMSGCGASDIVSTNTHATGFKTCSYMSGCFAHGVTGGAGAGDLGYGFENCNVLSACATGTILGNVHEGFHSCSYGSSLLPDATGNTLNTNIDTTDVAIVAQFSSHATYWT